VVWAWDTRGVFSHPHARSLFVALVGGLVLSVLATGPVAATSPVSGATVRVVNLVRLGAQATPILVFDTTTGGAHQRPVATLAYGTVSHALRPREDDTGAGSTTLSFYRAGTPSNATLLGQWSDTLHSGDRVTVLVQPNDDDPKHIPVYTTPEWEHGGPTPLPAATPGKALMVAQGFGLPKSSATTFGVQYGIVGHGCLQPAPDSLGNISYIGATNTVTLTIPPGHLRIAAYSTDDRTCTKKPLAGPVTVAANPGGRTYVLAFGIPHHRLQLLVVPIPTT
jgi:hypothetical protein